MTIHYSVATSNELSFGTLLRKWSDCFFRNNIRISLPIVYLMGLLKESYRNIKLLPIEWFDENKANLKKILDPPKCVCSYGPQKFHHGIQDIEQVKLPAIKLYHFNDALVSVLSSSIILDHKIIIERVEGVEVDRCHYYSGPVLLHDQKNALVRNLPIMHLEKGIFLGGNGSFNYYHWMIEILPKLQYLSRIDQNGYYGFPLLVSEDVNKIKTYREALNFIVTDRPIIILNKQKSYQVGNLLYINAPNSNPFNLRQNERYRVTDFLTNKSSIIFLRDQLMKNIDPSSHTKGNSRIFIARGNERRNYNENEIFEIFRERGFQKVTLGELSLNEQISLISNAGIIAGPTGAAWTNLIFCREGTKCLCWMAEEYGEFSAFSNLAKIVGADMYYVTFKTNAKSVGELYSANYSIDPQEIKQELEKLLNTAH